jgi:uncharacterized protein YjbJ (UPF0337 family)
MANEKLKGLARQVAGEAQEKLGKLSGRKTDTGEGKAKQAAGKVEETAGDAKAHTKNKTD